MAEYRIEKHTEPFQWWSPCPAPPPGWWLIWEDKAKVYKSWSDAIAGMFAHVRLRQRARSLAAHPVPEAPR